MTKLWPSKYHDVQRFLNPGKPVPTPPQTLYVSYDVSHSGIDWVLWVPYSPGYYSPRPVRHKGGRRWL